MDDAELTRKAIEELVRDAKEIPMDNRVEMKSNPLGRPNKRFLGRTINSMLTHNERESKRTKHQCQRKLKELEKKRKKLENKHEEERSKKMSMKRCRSESSHEVLDSSSSDENRTSHRKRKKKYRRSSQNRSLEVNQGKSKYHKNSYKKTKEYPNKNETTELPHETPTVDPNITTAISTIAQVMQYQTMMNTLGYLSNFKNYKTNDIKSYIPTPDFSLSSMEDCEEYASTIVVSSGSSDNESICDNELSFESNRSAPMIDLGVISLGSSSSDENDENINRVLPISADVLLLSSSGSNSSSQTGDASESTNLAGEPPDIKTNNFIDLT